MRRRLPFSITARPCSWAVVAVYDLGVRGRISPVPDVVSVAEAIPGAYLHREGRIGVVLVIVIQNVGVRGAGKRRGRRDAAEQQGRGDRGEDPAAAPRGQGRHWSFLALA